MLGSERTYYEQSVAGQEPLITTIYLSEFIATSFTSAELCRIRRVPDMQTQGQINRTVQIYRSHEQHGWTDIQWPYIRYRRR